MQFILTPDSSEAVRALSDKLINELGGSNRVLWLTSGGSNVEAAVKVMEAIPADLSGNLTVMLCDERYGPAGHPDSNWTQLLRAGFDPKSATAVAVLKEGLDFEETVRDFSDNLEKAIAGSQVAILQLGMGADGHVSGILPGSEAAKEEKALVVGYENPPYRRITTTFPALRRAACAYLFAFGAAKLEALQNLRESTLPLDEQPAQILKELSEAFVYNDQIGDPA